MVAIILVNILLIIWLYNKYQYISKDEIKSNIKIEEFSPAVIGYIDNQKGNPMDWVLGEILALNKNGYIDISYERQDLDKYEYIIKKKDNVDLSKLNKYQLTAYRLAFSDCIEKITIDRLEENIKRSIAEWDEVRVKGINIKKEIKEFLEEKGIIDNKKEKSLNIIKNIYFIITIFLLIMYKNISAYKLIILLLESICIFYICDNARSFTPKGKSLYNLIKEYKETLKDNELLKNKKIIHNILLGDYYINSIALHITSEARKEFIHDEIEGKQKKKILYETTTIAYVIILLIVEIIRIFSLI